MPSFGSYDPLAQDLTQPYHSKALPHATSTYYLRFVFSTDRAEMKRQASVIAGNRHFVYEDFVAYGLQQSYTESNDAFRTLARLTEDPTHDDAYMAALLRETRMDFERAGRATRTILALVRTTD